MKSDYVQLWIFRNNESFMFWLYTEFGLVTGFIELFYVNRLTTLYTSHLHILQSPSPHFTAAHVTQAQDSAL
jgi:hypothetical protein